MITNSKREFNADRDVINTMSRIKNGGFKDDERGRPNFDKIISSVVALGDTHKLALEVFGDQWPQVYKYAMELIKMEAGEDKARVLPAAIRIAKETAAAKPAVRMVYLAAAYQYITAK
jgi:hypothetical protein